MTGNLIVLSSLYNAMSAKGYSALTLSRRVPIEASRIADLVSRDMSRKPEPWLDEAYTFARILGLNDIATLIGCPIEDIPVGEDMLDDLDVWRSGYRLPLRYAVRLTQRFGLRDPYDLYEIIRLRERNPIVTGLWNLPPASGECLWCQSKGAHLDTCLLDNLWGSRRVSEEVEALPPYPRKPGRKQLGTGHKAPGLKALRKRLGVTQQNMADNLGCSLGHYCKMETLTVGLTHDNAEVLMRKFPPLTRVDLFTVPTTVREPMPESAPPPVVTLEVGA